jgi:DNA-binding MltR family transcriptional regulator
MVWFTVSDDDKPILAEIDNQTDRGAAIIAAAYLDERLSSAIKARLNDHPEAGKALFKSDGPLGSFSSRINLGLLMGVYDERTHKVLNTVRKIRNEFAHNTKPMNFDSGRVRDLAANLSLKLQMKLKERRTGEEHEFTLLPDGTQRTSFMNAVKLLLILLDLEIKQVPPRKPPPPVAPLEGMIAR